MSVSWWHFYTTSGGNNIWRYFFFAFKNYKETRHWFKMDHVITNSISIRNDDNIYQESNISKMSDVNVFSLFEVPKRKHRSHDLRNNGNIKWKNTAVQKSNTSLIFVGNIIKQKHGLHSRLSCLTSLPVSVKVVICGKHKILIKTQKNYHISVTFNRFLICYSLQFTMHNRVTCCLKRFFLNTERSKEHKNLKKWHR